MIKELFMYFVLIVILITNIKIIIGEIIRQKQEELIRERTSRYLMEKIDELTKEDLGIEEVVVEKKRGRGRPKKEEDK